MNEGRPGQVEGYNPDTAPEAKAAVRSLIAKIVAAPDDTPNGLSLALHGDLAQMLRISLAAQGPAGAKMQKPPLMRRLDRL